MSSDEQTVREFLAPYRNVPGVHRPAATSRLPRRHAELVFVAAAVVLAAATLVFAYLIHDERPSPPPVSHDSFTRLHGWIAIGDGAFDPNHRGRSPVKWPDRSQTL